MNLKLLLVAVALAIGFVWSACGGGDGGPQPAPTDGAGTAADTLGLPTMPPAPALTLENKQVEERGSGVELDVDDLPTHGSAAVWVLEPAGAQP